MIGEPMDLSPGWWSSSPPQEGGEVVGEVVVNPVFDLLIPLIAILPLAGFAITALVGRRLDKPALGAGRAGRRLLG